MLVESSFRAGRDGLDATIWHDGALRPVRGSRPPPSSARAPRARRGRRGALEEVERILRDGNGAERMRAAHAEGGMARVLERLVAETAEPWRRDDRARAAQRPAPARGADDRGAARALETAVAAVLDLRPAPDAVLVSGDLGERGEPGRVRARPRAARAAADARARAGRQPRRRRGAGAAFGTPARYTADVGELALVACHTPLPGRMEGTLDLDWLEAELEATRGRPVVIAMHHPPLLTGIAVLDEIGLPPEDRAALGELLARSPHVRRVVAGHVHRTAFAVLGGCGVVTAPSTNLQARLEIGARAFDFRPEPPGFLVHVELGGELVSHPQALTRG